MGVKSKLSKLYHSSLSFFATIIVDLLYNDFWSFRDKCLLSKKKVYRELYYAYLRQAECFIGIKSDIPHVPIFPHGMIGVFISSMASLGENVVIFQHVTIGSNTLAGHPQQGAPKIGNNVYIGAGAKIIGNVYIGDNCRIGANCVVVKDMPPNTTAVAATTRFIYSDEIKDNRFINAQEFRDL